VSSLLNCLGRIEENTAVVYTALADKLAVGSAKSSFLSIAVDHQKHSVLLKHASFRVAGSNTLPRNDAKSLAGVFQVTYSIYQNVILKDEIAQEELPVFAAKLATLEDLLSEKTVIVQRRFKVTITKSIDLIIRESFADVGNLFTRMVEDNALHRRLLEAHLNFASPKKLDNMVLECLPSRGLATPLTIQECDVSKACLARLNQTGTS